jgi:hypothetical protein
MLETIVTETAEEGQPPKYKFAVNSTIIQHHVEGAGKRRGMNSAMGGYWNNDKDGMWSFKYEPVATNMDVIVSLIWIVLDYPKVA